MRAISAYKTQFGLPDITVVSVPVDGGVATPGANDTEVCLNIEMVMAMAPGVSTIYVYEAPNPSPWVDLLSRMANDNAAKQLSCSWGGGSPDPTAEGIFQQMAAQGQSFYNASGDSDAFTGAVEFLADSPNITQVGGTTLATSGAGGSYPAVDFMSTVDTAYAPELNMWYHTLNCGFRTRISGETDFPCIYDERVGMGRSYVRQDKLNRLALPSGRRCLLAM